MQGQHSTSVWSVGRPRKQIPSELRKILDDTYAQNTDYVTYGDPDGADVQELIRHGKLYAERRELSFRYRILAPQPGGEAEIRFRLTRKRRYVKRNTHYWGVQ
jgi:hypothetical protein